ncbi:Pal1 cell morphology [Akanthomyces lecanii RCEF 1005]|uniref:Pal1 cell morphology n=1 Tax=Akanthomyces lecanii RCEF 1005 TaxID=1081108 RepID=A0A162N4C8_CORDF|nr:Pal1 cell morphology [Akanthomyces lecanii RCEF 1005]
MSAAGASEPTGQQGAKGTHLSANLLSNNPFRNRAASPSNAETGAAGLSTSPFGDPAPPRPLSRNPFLDQPPAVRSPGVTSTHSDSQSLSAEDIFNSLTLDDSKPVNFQPSSLPNAKRPMERRVPPPRPGEKPGAQPVPNMQKHRPTKSQEEALKARRHAQGSQPGSSRSPQRKPQRRPRRNSESSIMDFDIKHITDEERKMIEEKRREKDRLRREGRDGKDKGRSGRPSRRIDIIDQLDATSIYGTGLFHHDGPFDALNPHRNRQSSRRAPMQAFPKDSLNNSLGGSGPLNQQADHSTFMGETAEAFRDFAAGARAKNAAIFNPVARGDIIHGDESHGLGTSTFLEGTPAARAAIARRQAEEAQEATTVGIQRKKSLAHRIRHMNKGPREYSGAGQYSPEAMPSRPIDGSEPSQGYFSEFGKGEDSITVKRRDGTLSPVSPPPVPRRGSGAALERRATTDATSPAEETSAKPNSLLGRMKSLKGGRKPRNVDGANNASANQG